MDTTSANAWYGSMVGMIIFVALIGTASGQDSSSTQPGSSAPSVQQAQPVSVSATSQAAEVATYQQQQQVLMHARQALVARGATFEQLEAWQTQNAALFAVQLQRAANIATASAAAWAAQQIPMITEITVPAGATQEMANFLATRADLQNKLAQLHNTQTPNAYAVFQQQNAAEIAQQTQQAQVIAEQAEQKPLPVPPPLVIPPGTSPQMAAFLTLRDQLMRGRIAVQNQNVNADEATRAAAMMQWEQQNAALFQQMQAAAANLSATNNN